MHLLGNALAFIVALGVIIFVHEAGHYLVAKLFGVRVLTFSLGFGRRIWGFTRGETEYRVSWVPLGGYVRLGGENPDEVSDDPADFQNKPRWQRILVYLAGPAMNVLLAIVLIAIVFMVGLDVPYLQEVAPIVGTVEAGSPAEAAGIRPGDEVVSIAGREAESWQDVALAIMEAPEKEVALVVEREGETLRLTVIPGKAPKYEFGDAGFYPRVLPRVSMVGGGGPAEAAGLRVGDEIRAVDGRPLATPVDFVRYIERHAGEEVLVELRREGELLSLPVVPVEQGGVGRIGVGLTVSQRFPPGRAIVESLRYNWDVAVQTVALVGKLLAREVKPQSALHGPIEIAALSGEAARQGLPNLLHLMGLVSVSIAILNLLPIPVLDGGQIVILLVESLLRRDLSLRLKEAVNIVGLTLVMLLMVAVIFFDLSRNWPFGAEEGGSEPAPAAAPGDPAPEAPSDVSPGAPPAPGAAAPSAP